MCCFFALLFNFLGLANLLEFFSTLSFFLYAVAVLVQFCCSSCYCCCFLPGSFSIYSFCLLPLSSNSIPSSQFVLRLFKLFFVYFLYPTRSSLSLVTFPSSISLVTLLFPVSVPTFLLPSHPWLSLPYNASVLTNLKQYN